jgi:hypothetical protein
MLLDLISFHSAPNIYLVKNRNLIIIKNTKIELWRVWERVGEMEGDHLLIQGNYW